MIHNCIPQLYARIAYTGPVMADSQEPLLLMKQKEFKSFSTALDLNKLNFTFQISPFDLRFTHRSIREKKTYLSPILSTKGRVKVVEWLL